MGPPTMPRRADAPSGLGGAGLAALVLPPDAGQVARPVSPYAPPAALPDPPALTLVPDPPAAGSAEGFAEPPAEPRAQAAEAPAREPGTRQHLSFDAPRRRRSDTGSGPRLQRVLADQSN